MSHILLIITAFVAAAVSGAAGFGGALLLLPVLVQSAGPKVAVPLLTFSQLIGNVSRAGFGFREIRWKPVLLFLGGAIPMAVLGATLMVSIPKPMMTRMIGVAILIFSILRWTKRLSFTAGNKSLVGGGALTGLISGLVGSAGPVGAAVFFCLGLPPVAYVASEATTAVVMHALKMAVYQRYIGLPPQDWVLAIELGVVMIFGTLISNRFIRRLDTKRFSWLVTLLLVAIAIEMIVAG